MLYMIGIGLGDAQDITLRGLNAIKQSDQVFLEDYTSKTKAIEELEKLTEKKFIKANRELVEINAEKILDGATTKKVAFLVIGDVFGATTHTDLYLRAKKRGIKIKIINNTSIINAIGNTGLELYRFGQTTSIVFDDNNWLPETPYRVIKNNLERGLHTLCLLDIKTAEPSIENLKKGINTPEPPRFMTINKALEILLKLEEKHQEKVITQETQVLGVARLTRDDEKIKHGFIKELIKEDFKEPLHSLVIIGKLHDVEKEMLESYRE